MANHGHRGDLALTHDDLAQARTEYEAALAIARRLVDTTPKNAEYNRDLWVGYNKLGEVAQAGGDLSGARGFFEKGLKLTKALVAADPSNAELQVDLTISHLQLIGAAHAANDTAALRTHRDAAKAILDRLDREGKGKGDAQVAKVRAYLASLDK